MSTEHTHTHSHEISFICTHSTETEGKFNAKQIISNLLYIYETTYVIRKVFVNINFLKLSLIYLRKKSQEYTGYCGDHKGSHIW